jgi:phosphoglycolate phosphatase-like HAD superfamily hydrolase
MHSTSSAEPPAPSLLVLWDIDHTLLDTGGVGHDAYATAFRAATGVTLSEQWRFDGRTERAAAAEALTEHGLPSDGEPTQRLFDAIVTVHTEMAHRFAAHGRILPGARQALAALARLDHIRVYQSVLTGNLREVAAIKLAAFNLDQAVDLRIGAYGSDAVERTALAPFAFERAAQVLGLGFTGRNTVVIGDTPRDIDAARTAGALSIGVATGHHSTADLDAAGADVVFPDLSDAASLLDVLTAHIGTSADEPAGLHVTDEPR